MHNVRVDKEKNRLYVTLGLIESGEGEVVFNEIQLKLKNLTPGFAGVSDISAFKVADSSEGVWAKKTLSLLSEAGMGTSARITDIKGNGKQTIGEHGQPVFVVDSLEEADKLLDEV
ncbi:hypothetical protein QUF70_09205 [Desulfobacterales bacterium HSG17]|nr:hypothetical protein [Desulfobacterales bacterium HSG17]